MAQLHQCPGAAGQKLILVVNHRVLPVQGQVLYPEFSQFPFPDILAHQKIGQNGNTQPCLYPLQDDLIAGALPYRADIQLLRGQYTCLLYTSDAADEL